MKTIQKGTSTQRQDYTSIDGPVNTASYEKIEDALLQARALEYPSRDAILARDPSVQEFWSTNNNLLVNAWKEWDEENKNSMSSRAEDLLDSSLRNAIRDAWENPELESKVRDLLVESSPGVFEFQLFDPEKLQELRTYLEAVADAGIPLRAPYGISLNRNGAMLDTRSVWYLAAPSFQELYQKIMDVYMRPIARLLFPEIVGYDSQTYGFSIEYQPSIDTYLRMHTDASSVTMNVNLNLPDETFEGSELDFYDKNSGEMNRLSFTPGRAMIHRGNIAHAALPITKGKRTNFVFWLYGSNMSIPWNNLFDVSVDAKERWTIPDEPSDTSAPF